MPMTELEPDRTCKTCGDLIVVPTSHDDNECIECVLEDGADRGDLDPAWG